MGSNVTVLLQNAAGQIIAQDSPVTLSIASGPSGAVLGGTVTVNAIDGKATFYDLHFETAGTYKLTASVSGLAVAASASFTVSAAAASQMVCATDTTNSVAGVKMSPALSFRLLDPYGNLAVNDKSTVTLSIKNGPAGSLLTGTTAVKVSKGVATFNKIILKTAGDYVLHAADGALNFDCGSFTVVPGPAKKLVLNPAVATTMTAGTIWAPALEVRDAFGNVVSTSSAAITLVLVSGPKGYTFANSTVGAVAGAATFDPMALTLAGRYTFKASATGLTAASFGFTVTPATADHLTFVQRQGTAS
jgi:hypothetical protein